ncbi:MAG TPA: TrmH family RNA methyltransferase [Solirubrobacteraceae bacterium]
MRDGSLIPRFGRARRDPALAVLEGFHPVKHALRFGAHLEELVTRDAAALERLAERLAPDIAGDLRSAREVDGELFDRLAPLPPTTGVIALADRPHADAAAVLASPERAPIVLLENPRDLGNIGACVRVAAGADAAAVLSTGSHDPWHPDALRGSAGLHYALPVIRLSSPAALDGLSRPLLALDPEGEDLDPAALPAEAILAFGTERDGLSADLLHRADGRLRIPMRRGVSSLNLATSVAAVLFAWRLAGPARPPR